MNTNGLLMSGCSVRRLLVGSLAGCVMLGGSVVAAPLPKGNCADPKPYTDLRHCKFEGVDLKNKDLRGVDMRGIPLYKTQLQGANLTNSRFDGDGIMLAVLDGAKGLPQEAMEIFKRDYFVVIKNNKMTLNSLLMRESGAVEKTEIAGLKNIHMVRKSDDKSHIIALLDWPRYSDVGREVISKFDDNNYDISVCSQPVSLLSDERYYYPHWAAMKFVSLANGTSIIGVHAFGADSDGEGAGGWDMVAFIELTASCSLRVLHREDSTWSAGSDEEWCVGDRMDFRFLNDKTAEIAMSSESCSVATTAKNKITRKKIYLN